MSDGEIIGYRTRDGNLYHPADVMIVRHEGTSEAEWEEARDRVTEINDTVRNAVTIERERWQSAVAAHATHGAPGRMCTVSILSEVTGGDE